MHRRGGARIAVSQSRIRVVHVIPRYLPIMGGAELQCGTLLREFAACEEIATTAVITRMTANGLRREDSIDAVHVHRLGTAGFDRWGEYRFYLLAAQKLCRLRGTYDVIHGHATGVFGLVLGLAGMVLRKPVILKLSTNGELTQGLGRANQRLGGFSVKARLRGFMARAIGKLAVVVVLNEEGAAEARSVGSGHIVKIPNGVDSTMFYPAKDPLERRRLRQHYGIPTEQPVFVFSGRFVRRKGIHLLLQAFEQIFDRTAGGYLVLLGSAAYQDEPVKDLVEEFSRRYPDRLLVTSATQAEVAGLLRCGDWFVFPSLQEGMPNAVLEALASGLSCILSDIAPHREIKSSLPHAPIELVDASFKSLMDAIERSFKQADVTFSCLTPTGFAEKYSARGTARAYAGLYGTLVSSRR